MIYLDHNATTPIRPEVLEAMRPYLERFFGNPSSIHQAGRQARAAIDDARDSLAALLHAKPHELIFTGGGTESDNLALLGLSRSSATEGKRHLVSSPTEHHAVLHAIDFLVEREGWQVTWLPVDRFGQVSPGDLDAAITEHTGLVSIMSANNETGTLQPIAQLAEVCRNRKGPPLFHSDMIQSFGKQSLDVTYAGPDAISLAAHKFNGPKGAGLLWLRSGISLTPIQYGGAHENERRPGTENVAGIVGLAKAAALALEGLDAEHARQVALRDRLWEGIHQIAPEAVLNGHPVERLANTVNVSFPDRDGESLLINLDLEGVCASSGSACMVGAIVPSHVLLAMGVSEDQARSTVRFSIGKDTKVEEIEQTLGILQRILTR